MDQNLRKPSDFSQGRTAYHADAADVRPCRPDLADPQELDRRHGMHQERRSELFALQCEVVRQLQLLRRWRRPCTQSIIPCWIAAWRCNARSAPWRPWSRAMLEWRQHNRQPSVTATQPRTVSTAEHAVRALVARLWTPDSVSINAAHAAEWSVHDGWYVMADHAASFERADVFD